MQDRGAPRGRVQPAGAYVEPVVVEPGAGGAEGGDAQLEGGEDAQRGRPVHPGAVDAAEVAARAEAGHEGPHDHRDGVDAHAAVQGEDALPGDLVDEGGDPAHEESRPHRGQGRGFPGWPPHRPEATARGGFRSTGVAL